MSLSALAAPCGPGWSERLSLHPPSSPPCLSFCCFQLMSQIKSQRPNQAARKCQVLPGIKGLIICEGCSTCSEDVPFFFLFFLAILTLPLSSAIHLLERFFQNHLNNVAASEIHLASWLNPKRWALWWLSVHSGAYLRVISKE